MKLITELLEEPLALIQEASSKDGKKKLYIEGIYAQSEMKNRNGRFYPKQTLESAIDKYVLEHVNKNRACGELNHPPRLQVDFERATHRITEMRWDGNNVIGKAVILTSTPMGKLVEGLLEGGVQLGVSTRGAGTIKENNGVPTVGDDFFLTAVDVVSDPSAPDAFVNGVMEGYDFFINESGQIIQKEIQKQLVETYNKKQLDEKAKAMAFRNFIQEIKKL